MKIASDNLIPFPVARVWDALLDPQVLVSTIPGCERLVTTGENTYDMTVTAGVAAITGTYAGTCALSDLDPQQSLVMRLQGAGAPGTIDATVDVRFDEAEGGATRISYEADAVVGGMVGGVGQRMLTSVSKRMATEFFDNVGNAIGGGTGGPQGKSQPTPVDASTGSGQAQVETPGQVFTAPPKAGAASRQSFLTGIAVGAGLVLAGVIVGGIFGRRRS